MTPDAFAQSVVDDYNLGPAYHAVISKSIQDQLQDYKAHSPDFEGENGEGEYIASGEAVLQNGSLDRECAVWWDSWRKRVRTESKSARGASKRGRKRRKMVKEEDEEEDEDETRLGATATMPDHDGEEKEEKAMTLDEFEMDENAMHEDMRILIKVRAF